MTSQDLDSVAVMLVADGKGILAADETVPTLTKRFDTLGIQSTEQSRRTDRNEVLFLTKCGIPRQRVRIRIYAGPARQIVAYVDNRPPLREAGLPRYGIP